MWQGSLRPSFYCSRVDCGSGTNDVTILNDIVVKVEDPPRSGTVSRGKAKIWIQRADHAVLWCGDVICDERLRATPARRLNRDVHRLKLKLTAEHAAAHHPIFDFKHSCVVRRMPTNHRTDETIVTDAIQK